MQYIYPSYYKQFHCIAAYCPDSCCQGWDVVIDSETERYYQTVPGALGNKLRAAMMTDDDGDRVFRLAAQKRCPFWDEDKLCEIHKTLGEEHLCVTCARFPRLTMDYTVFCEHTLALACPEASRLILTTDDAYTGFDTITVDDCEAYDPAFMRFLLDTRREMADILTQDKPLAQRLDELTGYAGQVQTALTGEVNTVGTISEEVYGTLEYIDEKSRAQILAAAQAAADLSQHEKPLTNLALYWLYRYYLGAVDTLDVLSPIRFLVTSVGVVANLAADGDIITAAQLYSKEVEQSYENMERIIE